jgi:hypothetical protein
MLALGATGAACSTSARTCGFDAGLCPSGEVCIEPSRVCAQLCGGDGGATCPPGTTCQRSGTYCGTSCFGVLAAVCE